MKDQTVISQFSVLHEQDRDRSCEPGCDPNRLAKSVYFTSLFTVMDDTAACLTICTTCVINSLILTKQIRYDTDI